jgi:pyruvate-formate lyase
MPVAILGLMTSSRSDYNSDVQWLENEIAELNTFSELARQRALQVNCEDRNSQLSDIAAKLRVRAKRLADILRLVEAVKSRP